MDTKRICSSCGKTLEADAPQGICPACLLRAGFGSAGGAGSGSGPEAGFTLPPLETIARLFPNLQILGLIGQGGMGAVYKARQPALDRVVALKVLPPRSGPDPGFAERFTREARALAKLRHPNIVGVYDFGQVDGLHYFIMEYVDGLNLRQLQAAGKLSPEQALSIVPQICEALQFAHDEGIVHRDIKPENVLLDQKGRARIADFGLAKIVGREPTQQRLTGAKDVMGTPHYMAPEQVEHPREVDHRADIYSLGVVFYEMLTGELPLGRFAPPSHKVQIDVRLDDVVLHALEKEPERRYQHASDVKTDVETISGSPGKPGGVLEATVSGAAARMKWPALGVLAAGILNAVTLPILLLLTMPYLSRGLFHSQTGAPAWARLAFLLVTAMPLVLCAFTLFAGLKMKRLEAYPVAIAGSIVAMLIAPGSIVGLPAGIWALVNLAQPEIRRAFRNPAGALAWKGLAVAVAFAIFGAVGFGALLKERNHLRSVQAAALLFDRTFGAGDRPISGDLAPDGNGGWTISCSDTQTVRLFEVPVQGLERCILIYQAQLKSEGLNGQAYLEMWCHFPGGAEYFSRGLDKVIRGSNDWSTSQTPFFLQAGEKPDRVRLNLVIEGAGRVSIRDIRLSATTGN